MSRSAKTFGSRAEPRPRKHPKADRPDPPPQDSAAGTPLPKPLRGKRKTKGEPATPTGFGESPQPLITGHPIVVSMTDPEALAPIFVPHRPERPEKSEAGVPLDTVSEFSPQGDQPEAIAELVAGVNAAERNQVLLGVTGSG